MLALGTVLFWGLSCTSDISPPDRPMVKGMTLDSRRIPPDTLLPYLAEIGTSHLTLVSFAYQRELDVPTIRMNPDTDWYSESDRGIKALSVQAETLGMSIILKPHIWVGRYSVEGQTRANIGFQTEEDWHEWERQYHTYIMHYARLAEEIDAALLVIGTELHRSAVERPDFWYSLISDVRREFEGPLTYAANWWLEYEEVPFWDSLDYVGIQGYFDLSKEPDPDHELLLAGWTPHKAAMRSLSERVGKPVLFTELGYRNVPDAAEKPWRWPEYGESATVEPADSLQARLYEVFFRKSLA